MTYNAWELMAATWQAALQRDRLRGRLDIAHLAELLARLDLLARREQGFARLASGLDLVLFVATAESLPPLPPGDGGGEGRAHIKLVPALPAGADTQGQAPALAWRQLAPGRWEGAVPGGMIDIGTWGARLARLGMLWRRAQRLRRQARPLPLSSRGAGGAGLSWPMNANTLASDAAAWGLDPTTLASARARHPAALALLSAQRWRWPEVALHPDCPPTASRRGGRRPADEPLIWISEAGLARQPLHLWLGPSLLPACLGPTARDLGDALRHWAAQRPAELDDHLARSTRLHPEDYVYVLAEAFVRGRPDLAREHARACAEVGIQQHRWGSWTATSCQLTGIDWRRADPRIAGRRPRPPPATVVVIDGACPDAQRELLAQWCSSPGLDLASVTLLQPSLPSLPPSRQLVLPTCSYDLAAGRLHALPQSGLTAAEISAFPPADAASGPEVVLPAWGDLLAPSSDITWPERLGPLRPISRRESPSDAVAWLADAQLSGHLPPQTQITLASWPGPLPRTSELGSLAHIDNLPLMSALSLSLARRLLGDVGNTPPPTAPEPGSRGPPPGREPSWRGPLRA